MSTVTASQHSPSSRREVMRAGTALALAIGVGAVWAIVPSGAQERKSRAAVNLDVQGIALRGYDPVAYFSVGEPVPGRAEHQSTFEGATYRFSSAANKAAFDSAPARYVPQYGGFCAYAAANGYKYDADPRHWSIVEDKLYVNFDGSVARVWSRASARYIRDADANWPKVKDQLPR